MLARFLRRLLAFLHDAELFLSGKRLKLKKFAGQMNEASARLDFEEAAGLRDKIQALSHSR